MDEWTLWDSTPSRLPKGFAFKVARIVVPTEEMAVRARALSPGVPVEVDPLIVGDNWRVYADHGGNGG